MFYFWPCISHDTYVRVPGTPFLICFILFSTRGVCFHSGLTEACAATMDLMAMMSQCENIKSPNGLTATKSGEIDYY